MAGACAADGTDDSLTWFGVTLYGTVDVGYTYQNRGTPLNDYYPSGLEYLLQKNSSRSISSLSENGMSQSKVGLRGAHEFIDGWSGVFKLEYLDDRSDDRRSVQLLRPSFAIAEGTAVANNPQTGIREAAQSDLYLRLIESFLS